MRTWRSPAEQSYSTFFQILHVLTIPALDLLLVAEVINFNPALPMLAKQSIGPCGTLNSRMFIEPISFAFQFSRLEI